MFEIVCVIATVTFLISACELPHPITYRITDTESYTATIKGQKVINGFGRYSKLMVNDQHIPVLCNTILELAIGATDSQVRIVNCDVIEIERGHYEFCGVLHYLEIALNPISVLKNHTFSEMKVRHLNLSYNAIEWIEPSTFDDNQFLETVILRGNKLKIVHSSWFRNTTLLYKIDVGANKLWTLQSSAFKHLINNTFMCFILDRNSISRVHANFLNGFKLISSLNLGHNQISSLPADFIRHLLAFEVQLDNNKLRNLPLNFFQNYPNVFYLDLRKNKFSCKYMSAIKNYASYNKRTVLCSWEQCYNVLLDRMYNNWEVEDIRY